MVAQWKHPGGKLREEGADSLSDRELLAILISTGIRGKPAEHIAEEVLERLLEDLRELNEETKKEIEEAVREIKAGEFRTHEQLKAEMGF